MITINTNSQEIEKAYDELEIKEGTLAAAEIFEEQIRNVVSNHLGYDNEEVVEKIIMDMWNTNFDNIGELIQSAL